MQNIFQFDFLIFKVQIHRWNKEILSKLIQSYFLDLGLLLLFIQFKNDGNNYVENIKYLITNFVVS